MKKYRLKEEVKKYFNIDNEPKPMAVWAKLHIEDEALEEVPQRVKLDFGDEAKRTNFVSNYIQKETREYFSFGEKNLCEKALNGELLDIDSFSDFVDMYRNKHEYLNPKYLRQTLKAYLNQRK